jgi:putative pyruvate formate lyase activating enzyme
MEGNGFCQTGHLPVISKYMLHFWEEPCISGKNGSGTVFFSGCNLRCIYCQNYEISHNKRGEEVSVERLSEIFLELQEQKAHNINLVTPSIHIASIIRALEISRNSGLSIPVVYNTGSYENVETLKLLEGFIDVYLPDLKYFDDRYSLTYSGIKDYFSIASKAILEMFRQTGPPVFDEEGIIKNGMIIRHLIIPGHIEDSKKILNWIRENIPLELPVSLMAQYFPSYRTKEFPELNRTITEDEYDELIDYFFEIGLENGYIQELDTASSEYVPDFTGE